MTDPHHQPARHRRPLAAALLATLVVACAAQPDTERDADGAADAPTAGAPADLAPTPTTRDFLVTSIWFDVPEGIAAQPETVANPCGLKKGTDNSTYQPLQLAGLRVDGFDLDGADSQGGGPCPHSDYLSPAGVPGVDYGFLHVMDMIRPARPGQTIEVVLRSAPSQGLVRIGIRMSGVDDLENDDAVEVRIVTTAEAPLKGANGEILAGSSVAVDPDPAFRSTLPGRIVDGVLHAGPGDVTMGKINLLVAQDRVIALKDVRVRATLEPLATGGLAVDARIAGWWQRDSMVEAIGKAILTIGANPGELKCVLDKHADHSLDGATCDAMSTMLRARAVSGFITGLPDTSGAP